MSAEKMSPQPPLATIATHQGKQRKYCLFILEEKSKRIEDNQQRRC